VEDDAVIATPQASTAVIRQGEDASEPFPGFSCPIKKLLRLSL
jgi:hypothetical protein